MSPKRALGVVLILAVAGAIFSGVLSYQELLGAGAVACPSPGRPGTVLGYPACVYGFFMYVLISAVSLWGWALGRRAPPRAELGETQRRRS